METVCYFRPKVIGCENGSIFYKNWQTKFLATKKFEIGNKHGDILKAYYDFVKFLLLLKIIELIHE